jgi:hypothetical protein
MCTFLYPQRPRSTREREREKRYVSFKMPIHVVASELHQPKLGLGKLIPSMCSKWSLKTDYTISEYHEQPPLGHDLCHTHVSQIICSHLKHMGLGNIIIRAPHGWDTPNIKFTTTYREKRQWVDARLCGAYIPLYAGQTTWACCTARAYSRPHRASGRCLSQTACGVFREFGITMMSSWWCFAYSHFRLYWDNITTKIQSYAWKSYSKNNKKGLIML